MLRGGDSGCCPRPAVPNFGELRGARTLMGNWGDVPGVRSARPPRTFNHRRLIMKLRKCLLLSSAAGLAAAAGAQTANAADLPVKAQPVEYVKICSLYGDGFYYVPGTEICVRFAGNAQYDVSWESASGAGQPAYVGLAGAHTRESFMLEQK